jgi:RimJ/RimL family protein N-acetyltransferase
VVVALQAPKLPLRDGTVCLRIPREDDVTALAEYAMNAGGLEGAWLPIASNTSRDQLARIVHDWLCGWAGTNSHNGPALLLDLDGAARFVGHVGFGGCEPGVVELVYGVAPAWRGRGLATRATILVTSWLIKERAARVVELRIAADHAASRRVAEKAGFRLAGPVLQHVPRTGATYEDLRYVFEAV